MKALAKNTQIISPTNASQRAEYKQDKEYMSVTPEGTTIFAVDLQKVVMLPRIEQFKSAIFCHRLVAFNETFASIKTGTNTMQ